jgi:HAD superfamily hydrolase (TIGR01509 family)
MFHHIIFDCDGVLIDSEEISMRTDQALLARNGVQISEQEMHRRFVGKTFAAMVEELEAERGIRLPTDLEARKDEIMLDLYRRKLQPVAGIREALDAITHPKSIGTNGPRHRALLALEVTGIAHHFDGRLTTFEDVTRGKPFPDVYLLAAERAGFPPSECLVIEDSVTGVAAAVAAGCPTLGFTGSHLHRTEHALALTQLGARRVFNDMAELPDILNRLDGST